VEKVYVDLFVDTDVEENEFVGEVEGDNISVEVGEEDMVGVLT
jgi:hypothetical protein